LEEAEILGMECRLFWYEQSLRIGICFFRRKRSENGWEFASAYKNSRFPNCTAFKTLRITDEFTTKKLEP